MDGYAGRILSVDLSRGEVTASVFPEEWKRTCIGGRGLGAQILHDRGDPGLDPFDPDTLLVFAAGPLTGTGIPLGSRYDVITRSPLTGTITSANSGGMFGTAMKRAGFDAVLVRGRSPAPVTLHLHEGRAELHDASAVWGMTTGETEAALRSDLGGAAVRIACIGPAGERLARMACMINDGGRAAGRGGVGAVMGSKLLKAITALGCRDAQFAGGEVIEDEKARIRELLKQSGITRGDLRIHGTASMLTRVNELGVLPTCNFREGRFAHADEVAGERMTETIFVRRTACFACPVGCGRMTAVGPEEGKGPEYETIWAFGPNCGIDDIEAIARANYRCNELGLDTISTGATIACAMELSERGIIDERLCFGDAGHMVRLVEQMGRREGIGDRLAEGSLRFAARHGHPEYSMSVKGQELPAYDPRGLQGLGLNYATSVRGGCHVYGNVGYPEIGGSPVKLDPDATKGKATWTKTFQDLAAVVDASGICTFTLKVMWIPDYVAMLNAVCGFGLDETGLIRTGERIWNLQRLFNIRAGFGKKDDTLPPRLRCEPLGAGGVQARVWRGEEMLQDYYALRGWDAAGVPSEEKLHELGIASKGASAPP
ncbi:MAG TPA: aldehyde ferredoxin oxidoreductase [Methanoculleus sp.]|nr:aldehyde ferredoxin oxidoreductase [Methanoculleus sp.]